MLINTLHNVRQMKAPLLHWCRNPGRICSGIKRTAKYLRVYLCDELQIVDVVLLGDDQLVDVSLPLPLHGAQHVQQVQVSAP